MPALFFCVESVGTVEDRPTLAILPRSNELVGFSVE